MLPKQGEVNVRRIVIACLSVVALWSASTPVAVSGDIDLAAAPTYFAPQDTHTYKSSGYGMRLQGRFWIFDSFGIGVGIEGSTWDMARQYLTISRVHVGSTSIGSGGWINDGTCQLFRIGPSLLYRASLSENLELVLQAGVSFVSAEAKFSSDITFDVDSTSSRPAPYHGSNVDWGIIGIAGLELTYNVSKRFAIIAGAGYEFDIKNEEGLIIIGDQPLEDDSWDAITGCIGVRVRW